MVSLVVGQEAEKSGSSRPGSYETTTKPAAELSDQRLGLRAYRHGLSPNRANMFAFNGPKRRDTTRV